MEVHMTGINKEITSSSSFSPKPIYDRTYPSHSAIVKRRSAHPQSSLELKNINTKITSVKEETLKLINAKERGLYSSNPLEFSNKLFDQGMKLFEIDLELHEITDKYGGSNQKINDFISVSREINEMIVIYMKLETQPDKTQSLKPSHPPVLSSPEFKANSTSLPQSIENIKIKALEKSKDSKDIFMSIITGKLSAKNTKYNKILKQCSHDLFVLSATQIRELNTQGMEKTYDKVSDFIKDSVLETEKLDTEKARRETALRLGNFYADLATTSYENGDFQTSMAILDGLGSVSKIFPDQTIAKKIKTMSDQLVFNSGTLINAYKEQKPNKPLARPINIILRSIGTAKEALGLTEIDKNKKASTDIKQKLTSYEAKTAIEHGLLKKIADDPLQSSILFSILSHKHKTKNERENILSNINKPHKQ